MKILVTTSTFPVRLDDGGPRFIYDLAESLSAHAQTFILAPDAADTVPREVIGSVDVRRFSYCWPKRWQRMTSRNGCGMRENLRDSLLAQLQVPFFLARQSVAVRSLVQKQGIDAVNAHWIIPQGLTAAYALRDQPQVRLLLHIHAGDVYLLHRLPFGNQIARYVVQRADTVFADGSHVRDALDHLLGRPSGAMLQPMGVHCEAFARREPDAGGSPGPAESFPEGYIVFVGRLVEKKGTIYLIRAMQRLVRRFPGLGLIIIGDGPEKARLKRESASLGVESAVRFVGLQPHHQVVRFLHGCRVAAVPSIIDSRGETEGMPTVVVEAMAAGAPVVASAVAGIPDVIRHGENGWLSREKDPADLAETITQALVTPDLSAVIHSAIQTAETYDWQQVASNYMKQLSPAHGAVEVGV